LQYFQAYSEDAQTLYQEKAMDFYNTIEQTLVNGDIPLRYQINKTTPLKSKHHSNELKSFQNLRNTVTRNTRQTT
jgi:hypothetical protein